MTTQQQEIDRDLCLDVLQFLIEVDYSDPNKKVQHIYGENQINVCAHIAMVKHFFKNHSTTETSKAIEELHESMRTKMSAAQNLDFGSGTSKAPLITDFERISWSENHQRPVRFKVLYTPREYVEAASNCVEEYARGNNVSLLDAFGLINRKTIHFEGNDITIYPIIWDAIEKLLLASSYTIGSTTADQTSNHQGTDPVIALVLKLMASKEDKIAALQEVRVSDVKEMSNLRAHDSKDILDRTLDRMERMSERMSDKRARDSKDTFKDTLDRMERLQTNQQINLEPMNGEAFQRGREQGHKEGTSLASEQIASLKTEIGILEQKSQEDTARIQSLELQSQENTARIRSLLQEVRQARSMSLVSAAQSAPNPTYSIVEQVQLARKWLRSHQADLERQCNRLGSDSCLYVPLVNEIEHINEVLEITEFDDELKIRALQNKVHVLQERYQELLLQADALDLHPSDNEEDSSQGDSHNPDESESETSAE